VWGDEDFVVNIVGSNKRSTSQKFSSRSKPAATTYRS